MDIFVDFVRHVIVDNGADVFDIEAAGGDTGRNKDTVSTVLKVILDENFKVTAEVKF